MKSLRLTFWVWSFTCTLVNAAPVSKDQIDEVAIKGCRLVTSLLNPSILKPSAYFPEPDEIVAVLIQGTKPPPAMKNQRGAELCLYSVRTQSAHLAPWQLMENFKRSTRPVSSSKEF